MPGKYLLDTNVAIALLNGDAALTSVLPGGPDLYLPAVAAGELYFGAFKSARAAGNLARVDAFIAANVVLAADHETGRHYGQIKAELRARGSPIPDNDLWIAAAARQHDLTLASRDGHFANVQGLQLGTW